VFIRAIRGKVWFAPGEQTLISGCQTILAQPRFQALGARILSITISGEFILRLKLHFRFSV
jgi:hypothetical protein